MKKLYTGFGDMGYTQTATNPHILKSDSLMELLGTIDEFTSALGVAKAHTADKKLYDDIESIQKKLISVMGEISGGGVSVTLSCIEAVESLCDEYFDSPLTGFTLPGKNPISAYLNMARTIIRRAERTAVTLLHSDSLNKLTYIYINRLSDLIYAMSRYAEIEANPSQ